MDLLNVLAKAISERKKAKMENISDGIKNRLLFTQMQQGLAVHELIQDECGKPVDYRFLDVNESFERMTGLMRKDIINRTVLEILPETEDYWIEKYGNVALTGEPLRYENYSKEFDKYFEVVAYSPQRGQFAVIISDITDRKKLETEIANDKYLLETTLRSVGDGVISTDKAGRVVFMNRIAETLTGWAQDEARNKPIDEIFFAVNDMTREKYLNVEARILANNKSSDFSDRVILISKHGEERYIQNNVAPIIQEDGKIFGMVVVFRDFTEKRQKQEQIEYLSYHDQLTGLYNRRIFEETIRNYDFKANIPLTIAMIDANGLKLTNDAFGHKTGDEFLLKISEILKKACRTDDFLARIGGDEFVLLMPHTDSEEAKAITLGINENVSNEKLDNIVLSISIGYAVMQDIKDNFDDILKKAEDDMYKNKLLEGPEMRTKTIDLIMKTLHDKNSLEMLHSKRVSKTCEDIALNMNFSEKEIRSIKLAGLMHDIGKIGINKKTFKNPREMSDEERKEMERHSEVGYRILGSVNEFSGIAGYILEHHERWDGQGYPIGLFGEEISIQARIISIANAYDTITSDRNYKKALGTDEAVEQLSGLSGTKFDPDILDIFIMKVLGKKPAGRILEKNGKISTSI
ncbi:MAG: HD domain-containing phosphohydrolase [Saccharofermentanales bacterium]